MADQQVQNAQLLAQKAAANVRVQRQRLIDRRRLAVGTGLLVVSAIILVATLLFVTWSSPLHVIPSMPKQTSAIHTTSPAQTVSTPIATPTATSSSQDPEIAAQIDNLLTGMVGQKQFSGSVLIARNGQVLLNKGYGMANWDTNTPNTPQTRFTLGSTTKEFTAMAILILQERGKLHVQDHLCTFIEQCPAAWRPVTIHELLTHTSGIPQLNDDQLSGASPETWMNSYANVPLAFPAGSQYSYCSVCYQILGYVVERASGLSYITFLQQAIFTPLHMKNTGVNPNYITQPGYAIGYAAWKTTAVSLGWSMAPQWSFLFGSGLLQTTVGDMYLWDQALYTSTLVSQQTLKEAFTPYYTAQYPGSSYGYGWFIAKSPVAGHRLIWHDGKIDGFRTYIGRYVDDKVTIIFLSNLATLDELTLAPKIEHIIFSHI